MLRFLSTCIQVAIGWTIGTFLAQKTADVATDERTHNASRACCSCLVMIFGLRVSVGVAWGLWGWISDLGQPETY